MLCRINMLGRGLRSLAAFLIHQVSIFRYF